MNKDSRDLVVLVFIKFIAVSVCAVLLIGTLITLAFMGDGAKCCIPIVLLLLGVYYGYKYIVKKEICL